MKTRVVILSAFLTPLRSGAEACAEEVALRVSDRHDIMIVTVRGRRGLPKHDLLNGRVVVRRVGLGLGIVLDKWLFPFLAPFVIRKLQPQLIHAVLETFAGLALHFCKFVIPQAKRVLTLQTTNRSFLKGMIVRSPHAVTAISSALVAIAKGTGRDDVALIPNGIDVSAIAEARRRRRKVPGRVLFVGRLEKWKGVDVLLQAFASCVGAARCAARGKQSQTDICAKHLRVVGDGSQRRPLEHLTRELGITDHVTFVGFVPVPEVYCEFAQAEIFCALSRSEALGNVFLEALGAGCAVIGTNVGGIPDIVEDGVTGLLVPPDDPEAAADALQRLLSSAAFRQRLAAKGREKAQQYDWDVIAGRYARCYSSVL